MRVCCDRIQKAHRAIGFAHDLNDAVWRVFPDLIDFTRDLSDKIVEFHRGLFARVFKLFESFSSNVRCQHVGGYRCCGQLSFGISQ